MRMAAPFWGAAFFVGWYREKRLSLAAAEENEGEAEGAEGGRFRDGAGGSVEDRVAFGAGLIDVHFVGGEVVEDEAAAGDQRSVFTDDADGGDAEGGEGDRLVVQRGARHVEDEVILHALVAAGGSFEQRRAEVEGEAGTGGGAVDDAGEGLDAGVLDGHFLGDVGGGHVEAEPADLHGEINDALRAVDDRLPELAAEFFAGDAAGVRDPGE